ncbi:MAG: hypothetical protein KC535_03510 [Nanoarchaeota archaeon]|nr:hypothetical protein [Nanoarchaeota archaeon]
MVMFKKKCGRCKKNYVPATNKTGFVICYECQEKQMQGEIKDPEMKKMFDIPKEFYEASMFLRDIKIKYLQFGSLSERQIEAFRNTVERFKEEKNDTPQ